MSLNITFNIFLSLLFSSSHLVFFCALTINANSQQKWAKFFVKVLNDRKNSSRAGVDRSKHVLLVFVAGSGDMTQIKLELVNAMLCDWQVDLVMKRKPKPSGEKTCPYYSLCTQNKMLWTFYAHMKKGTWLAIHQESF